MSTPGHTGPFPHEFLWGAGTSAVQIEGAAADRGPSIWDDFCARPGAVRHADSPAVACDHVRRVEQDADLIAELGLQAYRFSIAWPRVLPRGTGEVSDHGLGFYDRLVDLLLDRGVRPFVTLFHWDLPLELHRRGGWLNEDSPAWFERYAAVVAATLGDRVRDWLTINEPQVHLELGYASGIHAPGLRLPIADRVVIAHRLLLAHGRGVRAIREHAPDSRISWAPVGIGAIPDTADDADVAAARRVMLRSGGDSLMVNTWFNDPAILGRYPDDGLEDYAHLLPGGWEDDLETIAQPLDLLGFNHYHADRVRMDATGRARVVPYAGGVPRTAFGWPVTPESLYWITRTLHDRYRLPLVITENGLSTRDWPSTDRRVHDPQRIDFMTRYLRELARAVADGADVRGYFHWSLMDNFEWAEGYEQRFGLVHVDYRTQARTPKDSATWYRTVIRSNGRVLIDAPEVEVPRRAVIGPSPAPRLPAER